MAGIAVMCGGAMHLGAHFLLGSSTNILQQIVGIDNYLTNIIKFSFTIYSSCQFYRLATTEFHSGKTLSFYDLINVRRLFSIACISLCGIGMYNLGFYSSIEPIKSTTVSLNWIFNALIGNMP
jgi:hypothetical protein